MREKKLTPISQCFSYKYTALPTVTVINATTTYDIDRKPAISFLILVWLEDHGNVMFVPITTKAKRLRVPFFFFLVYTGSEMS